MSFRFSSRVRLSLPEVRSDTRWVLVLGSRYLEDDVRK
jgi:hypothetical protein